MTADQISIKIVRCINYCSDNSWNHSVNLYPYNTLYFIIDGDGYIKIKEETIPLKQGYAYLIPANTMFSCWCDTYIHKIYADVHVEIVPGTDIFSTIAKVFAIPLGLNEIKKMIEATKHENFKNLLYVKGQITSAISMFIDDNFQVTDKEIFKFKPILDDIEQNLTSQLKVNDIAVKYGWNPSVLSRKFKKVFGCSLKSYIEKLLLSHIKQNLIATDLSIKELAIKYQFCDQYYLSSFFKKHEKCSPSEYKKQQVVLYGK